MHYSYDAEMGDPGVERSHLALTFLPGGGIVRAFFYRVDHFAIPTNIPTKRSKILPPKQGTGMNAEAFGGFCNWVSPVSMLDVYRKALKHEASGLQKGGKIGPLPRNTPFSGR
jgi:hypothetical protein